MNRHVDVRLANEFCDERPPKSIPERLSFAGSRSRSTSHRATKKSLTPSHPPLEVVETSFMPSTQSSTAWGVLYEDVQILGTETAHV
jgi:hypothetical protein